jgi:hypothetical protein
MSMQDRLAKLQSLLARVQRRASQGARPLAPGVIVGPEQASAVSAPSAGAFALASLPSVGPVAQATPQPPGPVTPAEGSGVHELTTGFHPAEAELESTPEVEELSEEDLVEMSSDVLESVPPLDDVPLDDAVNTELERQQAPQEELDFEDAFEPPASSRRPRTVPSLDEVLGFSPQDEDFDLQRDAPAMTPPPESGPQEAPMPPDIPAPLARDFVALLESRPPPSAQVPTTVSYTSFTGMPAPEQLGQTIDLEEPSGPALELGVSSTPSPPANILEELEVTLPVGTGRYDRDLVLPADLRDELEAHRRRDSASAAGFAAPPPAFEESPSAPRGAHSAAPTTAELEVGRPALSGINPVVVRAPERAHQPRTFAELLDASIALGI